MSIVLKFLDDYELTEVDSYRKPVSIAGEQVMIDIVDTAGREHYAAVRDHYLRTADGYLCVFSLSEPESLQDIIDLRSATQDPIHFPQFPPPRFLGYQGFFVNVLKMKFYCTKLLKSFPTITLCPGQNFSVT